MNDGPVVVLEDANVSAMGLCPAFGVHDEQDEEPGGRSVHPLFVVRTRRAFVPTPLSIRF
jgi:hypothetical protein